MLNVELGDRLMVGQRPFAPEAHPPSAEKHKMFETYVLKSDKDGIRYVGSGESADERLRRHNKGDYHFTKGHLPWKIVYREKFETRPEAVRREKFLKSGQGRKFLDSILK